MCDTQGMLVCRTVVTAEVWFRNLLRSANNVAKRSPLLSLLYSSGLSEKTAATLSYVLGLPTGLFFFYLDKRPFVRFHAVQSIITFGGLLLAEMLVQDVRQNRFGLGRHITSLIALVPLVLWIVLMITAYQGKRFKLPIAGDVAEILAGPSEQEREAITSHGKQAKARSAWFEFGNVALAGVGVLFVFGAAFAFVRGLWHLFIFLGGILFYGSVLFGSEMFPEQLGGAIFDLMGPALFGAIGAFCMAAAKRLRARQDLDSQAVDVRAPVLYLRSFLDDRRLARRPFPVGRVVSFQTEEEQFAEAVRYLGPVVALGRPGERLPRLGAQRVYVKDAEWRQQVLSWLSRAALVVVHVPAAPTEGLSWEIEQSLRTVELDRLVFLIARSVSSAAWISQKLRDNGIFSPLLPKSSRAPYGSRVSGIVYLVDGRAEFRALVKPPFLNRPFWSPLVPVYQLALGTVTARIAGRPLPLSEGFGDLTIAAVWMLFCVLLIASGVYLRITNPAEREFMICGQSVMKHVPAEARQLANDALSQWLQTHVQRGLRYVPDDVALARANVLRQLFAIASPATCAALADGVISKPALDRLLNELAKRDRTTLTTWCTCQERALQESLVRTPTRIFGVSEDDASSAFRDLYKVLSEEDNTRFDRIAADYGQASPEDHCWFASDTRRSRETSGTFSQQARSDRSRTGHRLRLGWMTPRPLRSGGTMAGSAAKDYLSGPAAGRPPQTFATAC